MTHVPNDGPPRWMVLLALGIFLIGAGLILGHTFANAIGGPNTP